MKQIFKQIGLSAAMLLVFLPAFAHDFEANGLYFDIISVPDGTCRLVSCSTPNTCNTYVGDFVIPESVEYKNRRFTVTAIGEYAFINQKNNALPVLEANTQLKSVKIPNTIKSIESNAFDYCSSLQTIEIPNSVIKIGSNAFRMCTSLQSITIPNSVVYIGGGAFIDCTSLQSVIIPNSVTVISSSVFSGCTSLQSVIIPNSVTVISSSVFSGCTSLKSVIIPNSVKIIDSEAFYGCTSLQSIIIPNSITRIAYRAFNGCENLKEVTFCSGSPELNFFIMSGYVNSDNYQLSTIFNGCKILTVAMGRYLKKEIDYRGFYSLQYEEFKKEDINNLFSNVISLRVLKGCDTEQISLFSNISHLSFEDGYDLMKVSANFNIFSKLQTLTLESATPPVCPKFTNNQYLNVILYVPTGTLETYQKADGWKYFFDIREVEVSGVKEVQSVPRRVIGRYDINGNRVDEDFKGITIVKFSDGSTKKYINR